MKTRSRAWSAAVCVALVTLVACESSPVSPSVDEEGSDGTPSDTLPADAPNLPVPAGPLADVPASSDTVTVIRALATNFRPRTNRLRGEWSLQARECLLSTFFGCSYWWPWQAFPTVTAWSNELPSRTFSETGSSIPMALAVPILGLGRILLVEDGSAVVPPVQHYTGEGTVGGDDYETIKDAQPATLSATVYLRRDRYWERQQLSSGVGEYLLVTGDTEASLETTYSSGTSRTETEEFGRSVSATAGLSFGPLAASVTGTLSSSYSTSIQVREDKSETFTRTVRGTPGQQTRFMIWVLVERYTFTDENGEPFVDANYQFITETLYRRGVATALQATEFPLP